MPTFKKNCQRKITNKNKKESFIFNLILRINLKIKTVLKEVKTVYKIFQSRLPYHANIIISLRFYSRLHKYIYPLTDATNLSQLSA